MSLNANRKRRLIANLDKALAKQGIKRPRRPATPAASTTYARLEARSRSSSARMSYAQLRAAILAAGGLRANRDYAASEIPRDLRAKRGQGLAPDEMASVLEIYGYHFDGDVDLFAEIGKRKGETQAAREGNRPRGGPSHVCNCRDERGRFQVCPHGS